MKPKINWIWQGTPGNWISSEARFYITPATWPETGYILRNAMARPTEYERKDIYETVLKAKKAALALVTKEHK